MKKIMQLRDAALARYRREGSVSAKTNYKDLKSMASSALLCEKRAYYNTQINSQIGNPKSLWKNLKKDLLPPTKYNDLPAHFDNPNDINKHFLTLPRGDAVKLSRLTYFEYHTHKNYRYSFSLKPVSQDKVGKILLSLKSNAKGVDNITLDMILLTLPHTLPHITHIINTSLTSHVFPTAWKTAKVTPIPKTADPQHFRDLRPISLLPCLSKVLEKVVHEQVISYLEENNILPTHQSGFRKGRGTATALMDVVDNILAAQDQGEASILVLLDFTRAFDCIHVPLLLSKLSYYGFDEGAVSWFSSYLMDRSQFVELARNNCKVQSDKSRVNRGVPQGSILGPLLFILYSSDVTEEIRHCRYHMYADDLQVYVSFKPRDTTDALLKLNADLSGIAAWAGNNTLVLNPTKSKFMLFGTKQQIAAVENRGMSVVIDGESVERVWVARNLGVIFDAGLRFESHVNELARSCLFKLKLLYGIRRHLCKQLRARLCEALVLSRLNYCYPVFGPCLLARSLRVLQRIQNACVRFSEGVPPRSHISPVINSCNMLNMKARRDLHFASLLFDVVNCEAPKYLHSKLNWASSNSVYNTRGRSWRLITPRHKTAAFRGSFRYSATKCWNNLPPPIRQCKSKLAFKLKLKKHLLSMQILQQLK